MTSNKIKKKILFSIALRSNCSLPKPVYTGTELQRQIITCQRVKPRQLDHNTQPQAVLLFPLCDRRQSVAFVVHLQTMRASKTITTYTATRR